jgi:diguanylate cyclase (GGDEF)-like protein
MFARAAADGTGIARYTSPSGNELVAGYRHLPAYDLAVVLEMDYQQSFAAINRLRDLILLVCLLSAAVITALGYGVVLSLTGPIQALISGAQAVAGGNLSQEVPVRGSGEIRYLTEVFNDMTRSLRETHDKLEELSLTDELTGLVNRRHLSEMFQREIRRAERNQLPLAVLMIDLDHFKRFNDRLGHLAGDDVLRRLGKLLKEQLRPTDIAARYGGEEFVVLLPGTRLEEAGATAERLRAGFSVLAEESGKGVSMSIGVATIPESGKSEEEVLAAADAALYEAKRTGRNRVVTARPQA